MLWYIFSAIGFIVSGFSYFTGYNYPFLGGAVFGTIFLVVSTIVTLTHLYIHKEMVMSLPKRKNEIEDAIEDYKIQYKEMEDLTKKVLAHELELIKTFSQDKGDSQQENVLSFNSTAQLPIGQASLISQTSMTTLKNQRGAILGKLKEYNDRVLEIEIIQHNSFINTPLIKNVDISYLKIYNFDNIETIKVA